MNLTSAQAAHLVRAVTPHRWCVGTFADGVAVWQAVPRPSSDHDAWHRMARALSMGDSVSAVSVSKWAADAVWCGDEIARDLGIDGATLSRARTLWAT